MEDSGGSALGDVHFSAQSSKKLCCNRCVLKYDKMQVGAKEFENMQPGVKMIMMSTIWWRLAIRHNVVNALQGATNC